MTAKQADKRKPLDLAPIKERIAAATDGHWYATTFKSYPDEYPGDPNAKKEKWLQISCDGKWAVSWCLWRTDFVTLEEYEVPSDGDVDLIVSARQDMCALVAEVEQLRKENDELRRKLKKGRDAAEAIFKAHTP